MGWLRSPFSASPPKPFLVDFKKLETLIASMPVDEQVYLTDRWLAMVRWWEWRSNDSKRKYGWCRAIIIGGGGLTTVLTTVQLALGEHFAAPQLFPILLAITGAVVAATAAWDGIQSYGEVWRDKRRAGELLKVEGWLFLSRSGDYAQAKDAFRLFAAKVEAMFAKEVGDYVNLFDTSKEGKQIIDQMNELSDRVRAELKTDDGTTP
jgi:Protein of unknown function (DUF4231)